MRFRFIIHGFAFWAIFALLAVSILLGVAFRFASRTETDMRVMDLAGSQYLLLQELTWRFNAAFAGKDGELGVHVQRIRYDLLPLISQKNDGLDAFIKARDFGVARERIVVAAISEYLMYWREYIYPSLHDLLSKIESAPGKLTDTETRKFNRHMHNHLQRLNNVVKEVKFSVTAEQNLFAMVRLAFLAIIALGSVVFFIWAHKTRMITVEHKKTANILLEHSNQLIKLIEASYLLIENKGTRNVYHEICRIARDVFKMKMVWLGLVGEDRAEVRVAAASGDDLHYLRSVEIYCDDSPEGKGPVGMAIKKAQPMIVKDVASDPDFVIWRDAALARGYRAILAVPLIQSGGKVLGSLNFYHTQAGYFTEQRVRMLHAFANQALTAIENASLLEGLESSVRTRTMELERANAALSAAKEMAESASKAKSVFLANMSHELRTPLNSVIGFSELMINGLAGEMSDSQKEYLTDINESGAHLLKLINEILDLSKIEAGRMELEYSEMDVGELMNLSLMFIKQKALKHGLRLELFVEERIPPLMGDERKIKQVLVNLLGNAAKFTPDKGTITLRAEIAPAADEMLRRRFGATSRQLPAEVDKFLLVSVIDTGCGIKEEDIHVLFEPFTQAGSVSLNKSQGTGLGLTLCKKIVEMHQGTIWLESEYGKGSCFGFYIPCIAAGAAPEDDAHVARERSLPI